MWMHSLWMIHLILKGSELANTVILDKEAQDIKPAVITVIYDSTTH